MRFLKDKERKKKGICIKFYISKTCIQRKKQQCLTTLANILLKANFIPQTEVHKSLSRIRKTF